MLALFKEQPPAFRMIFLLEIWERFGYYTMQGILALFFIRQLGYSETEAYYTFGAFFALVYGYVAIGGYLGDKVLGTKRTILLGLTSLTLGYLALALAEKEQVFFALGLICVGNGLFKANPSSLLARCYEPNDERLHGAFTLYYMSVNLGSTVSLIIGPYLSSKYGYFYAYFSSFIGLSLGLLNYFLQRRLVASINNEADLRGLKIWHWLLVFLGIILFTLFSAFLIQHTVFSQILLYLGVFVLLLIYLSYLKKEERPMQRRMFVALILMVEGALFFVLYQQMPTSINLFAVNNVNPTLLGFHIDPQSFQVLNPAWIIILSPILAYFYRYLHHKNRSFQTPYKFALGMILCGFSFLVLFISRFFHDEMGMVSSWWMISSYFFQTISELLVSAIGVAMVAELVPLEMSGFAMGFWFVFSALAGFIGAFVASFTALPKKLTNSMMSLFIYTNAFLCIGLITIGIGLIFWFFARRLSEVMSYAKEDVVP